MSLAYSQIDDAVLLTQQQFVKKGAFTDLQTDLQDHVAVREMWEGRKKKFEGGEDWEFNAQMDHNYSAKTVGLFETDSSNLTDTMVKGNVPARHVNAHYIYDKREKDFQRGGTGIVDLVMTRYTAMMVSFYELLEELLWSKPDDDSNVKDPFGVKYWITRNATEGFTGANPSGFTSGKAGINASTYARWKNWSAQYTDISKTDLVRKMRKAARECKFRSPVTHAVPTLGGMKRGIYMNSDTLGLFEEILEAQNMSLGNDVASKDGRAQFKGHPLTYAPYLDSDTTDPVYMIDWSVMAVGVMDGWENNLTAPYMVPNKHLVSRVDMDASLNMVCTDLRKQAVFYK